MKLVVTVKHKVIKKTVPVMGIVLIFLGLLTMFSYSIFSEDITFSNYGGIIIESNDELSVSSPVVERAGLDIPAAGTTPETAVTLSSSNPFASTGVAKKNWLCRIDVDVIDGTTPANTTFKVELYRWNSTTLDYNLLDTLYIKSDADPASGESARLMFD
ncbi:MAG: hypothetical protein QXJ68_06550, partial [Methanocellales archaeon]